MEAGESKSARAGGAPAPEVAAACDELLPGLPEPLRHSGKALIQALHDHHQVEHAFSTFCSAAYVKPDWAGAASEFLSELFADQEDLLAELARIPDLIIELATGHITLTCMVASRWAARSETQRLARLAEALIATQSKMSGDGVVEVMLALATSLAITRYSRAEQLLTAAEPHATSEQQETLAEARQWLAAGKVVRSCSQEARDLWDQRLRRPNQQWSWVSREERQALMELADHVEDGTEGAPLFKAVLPPCWWDLATGRTKRHLEPAPPPPSEPLTLPVRQPSYASEPDLVPAPRWGLMPFLGGVAIGALSATTIFLLSQPHRWSSESKVLPTAVVTPAPAADSTVAAAEDTAPENPTTDAEQEWRQQEIQALMTEMPELLGTAAAVKGGVWAEHEALLTGESTVAPLLSTTYQKLLLWMHLDPPADPELRSKIPMLLASLRQDDTVLDLWKKLIYPGSPNADDIRAAAKQQIHRNSETKAWTAEQVQTLEQIAGWSVATAP